MIDLQISLRRKSGTVYHILLYGSNYLGIKKMEKLGVHRDASQLISVREFLTSWDASVIPGMEMISTKSDAAMLKALSKEMGTPIDTLQELGTVCGYVIGNLLKTCVCYCNNKTFTLKNHETLIRSICIRR